MKADDKLGRRVGLPLHSCRANGVDKVLNLPVDSSSGLSYDSPDHPQGNPFFGLSFDLLRRDIDTMKAGYKLGCRDGLPLHSCCASGVDKVPILVNLPDSPDRPHGLGGGSLA